MINALLATIVPTFGIIGIGWLARRVGIWEKSSVKVLNNYAYYLALPALIFQSLLRSDIGKYFGAQDVKLLLGVLLAHVAVFLLVALFCIITRRSKELRATAPMLATLGNTAYLGIPFATYAFGAEGTAYASILSVLLLTVFIFASIGVLNRFGRPEGDAGAMKKILELPFLWAVVAGLLLSFAGITVFPLFLSRFIAILSDSAGPTALLGLGTFLFDIELHDIPWKRVSILSAMKVLLPTLGSFFLLRAFGVTGVLLAIGVAVSGTSTAVTTFVLSTQYRIGERLTAGTILVSTFFSLFILSAVSALWIGTAIFH